MKRLILLTLACMASAGQAVLVDNFESYELGAVDGSSPWSAGSANVIIEAEDGNQYLAFAGMEADNAYLPLADNAIAEGESSVFFYRLRPQSATIDMSVGLSPAAAISTWGDFAAYVTLVGDGSFIRVLGRNGGSQVEVVGGLSPGEWINIWLEVDTSSDTYNIYYGTDLDPNDMDEAQQVGFGFAFRNTAANGLGTFGSYGWNTDVSTLQLDDIYKDGAPIVIYRPALYIMK